MLKRRRRLDADFSREIAAHLALEADRLIAEGRSPEDATYEARRRFGNVAHAQEAFHERRTPAWLEAAPRELRLAGRRLARKPVFAVTATLTLMLGIGATTAVFSLVDGVLLRPLPFAHPERLVDISHTIVLHGVSHVDQSDATYLYYRRANHVFSAVGAYRTESVNLAAAGTGNTAHSQHVEAARASASVFRVLGVAPMLGRVFRDAEDRPGAAPIAVLGARLWKGRFAGDPNIIGRTIMVDGVARTVVGVMPQRFAFPDERTALWLPVGIDPAKTASATFDLRVVARLRAGVTRRMATTDLAALLPQVPLAFPGRLTVGAIVLTHMRPLVRSLRAAIVGGIGRALWVVFGAAAFLLLIACANVANLFLVRAEEKQHDVTVRRALGAGRGAIIGEFFAEGLILSVVGCVLGLAVAAIGLRAVRATTSGVAIPRLDGVRLDGTVIAVAAGVTVLVALAMSVVPALRLHGPDLAAVLTGTSRGATAGRSRHRARRLFVVVQVALALVLVSGAGLMARTYRSLRSVRPGFDPAGAYTFRVALPSATYPTTADAVSLVTRALSELSALPGVTAAGVATKIPLDPTARRDTAVFLDSRPLTMGQMPDVHQVGYASPGAFRALGIPLIAGRTFAPPTPAHARLEAIVTHALARRYWGDAPVVGRGFRLAPNGPRFTIVGVTADVHGTRLDDPPDEMIYLPLVTAPGAATADSGAGAQRWIPRELAFVVRSTAGAHTVTARVERTLREIAPTIPVYDVHTMDDVVARSTARTSFTLTLLEIASLAALLIGAVGLYGVVSYMVSLRVREMAVRMALGAQPRALRRQVMGQAAAVAALGIALGLGAAVISTRFLAALLFGVSPADRVTLLGAVALMAAVAAAASWFPARRAAAIDIATTLRPDV